MSNFHYGSVSIKRRFSITLPLDAYFETIFNNVVKISLHYYYKNPMNKHLYCDFCISYYDDFHVLCFARYDAHEYTLKVIQKNDMVISL